MNPSPTDPRVEAANNTDPAAPGLPGERTADPASVPPEYRRAFSIAAFAMNRFIIDQVVRAARFFDNDIEAMVLYGMLSHLNAAHLVPPGSRPTQVLNEHGRVPDAQPKFKPVRISDLAQISGRPRETIRRKLERLERCGRVTRLADGYVLNLTSVDEAMLEHSLDALQRFMQTATAIEGALRDARGGSGGAQPR
jgi:hypothetical protein